MGGGGVLGKSPGKARCVFVLKRQSLIQLRSNSGVILIHL